MGNAESTLLSRKLSHALPSVEPPDHQREDTACFRSIEERDQFITATIALVTRNGLIQLDDHDLKLSYTGQPGQLVARILAIKDGSIAAKLSPQSGGYAKSEMAAFEALRVDVQQQFEEVLQSVPDLLPKRGNAIDGQTHTSLDPLEDPPPYVNPSTSSQDVGKEPK